MIRRPRRSVPAAIVALLLLAVCVLTVVSVAQSLLGRAPSISLSALLAVGSGQTWNGVLTVVVAIVAAVLGLILLLVAVRPGRPTVMPLVDRIDRQPATSAGVHRASLTKDLTSTVAATPGVTRATVTTRRSAVTASIRVAAADPMAVPGQVRERLEGRLAEIGPAPSPRVRIRARREATS